MKHLFTILAALLLCSAPAQAQTMKALMYGTNGTVVANTGTLTFTNASVFPQIYSADLAGDNLTVEGAIYFTETLTNVSVTRANLGFSTNLNTLWTATNASNARSAVGLQRIWAYKSTNQTNATTNLVSDSALTFTAAANTKYAVELFLVAKSSMAALQGKINSTNATPFGFWVEYDAASQFAWLAGNGVTNRANLISFDGNDVSVWQRFVIVAPTNSATVTFQFAPADTNGSAIIAAGSYLKAEVIE